MKNFSLPLFIVVYLLLCISTAHAIPVEYWVRGNFEADSPADDPLNWGGEAFDILLSIDSNKAYSFNDSNATEYVFDEISVNVGTEPQVVTSASMRFDKGGSGDMFKIELDSYPGGSKLWGFSFYASFDNCYFGDPDPIPIIDYINENDANIVYASATFATTGPAEENELYAENLRFGSRAVPEPTTMLLFGAGLVGIAGFGRKKFKK